MAQPPPHRTTQEELMVIPVLDEQLHIEKRTRDSGGVRLRKTVVTRDEVAEAVLQSEDLAIERVAVNRQVPAPPPVRYEGETLVVPVLEEVLVVEKRLVLREELRITRRVRSRRSRRAVPLRRELVAVERLPPSPTAEPDDAASPAQQERERRFEPQGDPPRDG